MATPIMKVIRVENGAAPKWSRRLASPHRDLASWWGRVLGTLALTAVLATAPWPADAADKLGICYGSVSSALIPLARQQGFFAAEGVDVEVIEFPSGKQSLEAMFAGKCALSMAGEIPPVHQSLGRKDFSIVAVIATNNNFERIIARGDRGIASVDGLRGRRIAVAQFTTAHFFLDTYLATNGIPPGEVTRVYLAPQDVAGAFRRGEVDAAAHWEPHVHLLTNEFGAGAKVFSAPGLHESPILLMGGRDYVRQHRATVERVLRALIRAERFVKEQPANAKVQMERIYSVGRQEIDFIWPLTSFRVTLEQPLLFILENSARWAIGLMPVAQRPALPNYLDFIYLDPLRAVKPAAVTIIH